MDIRLIVSAVALAASAGAGWHLRDLQADADELARIESEKRVTDKLQELADRVDYSTNAAIANIRIENRTIHQKAVHEIQTETIYRECRLPDAGRVLVNEARSAANAAGATMPAPASAAR